MPDLGGVTARLQKSVSEGNQGLSNIFMDLELSVVGIDSWPLDFFDVLLGLLGNQKFLDLQDSWRLVYFINNNWEQISVDQRNRLREPLEKAFPEYSDWMGAFVTSEVLGERYADTEALAALSRLAKTARSPARALVPHGLESLAKTSDDEQLREHAIRNLRDLARSDQKDVKGEAELSLTKLGIGK
jgi:hypothetical protein